ncbi:GTP-binding protein, partial [Streptococcus pneumoniae]|nr:GTP-binding protein [Streptococcus pneumoniae]
MFDWIMDWPVEIVRAKGFLRIATRDSFATLLSQAGPSASLETAGAWDEAHGVKMTELVLIGIKMDQRDIIQSLDSCLL